MTAEPVPAWMVPPVGGFTAEDLDQLPELPPHAELIDGSLVLVSPQARFHSLVMLLLQNALARQVPDELSVEREMTVRLDRRNRPEPDLMVVRAAAARSLDLTFFDVADVVLAVEVVSPESAVRDRGTKMVKYAQAGIPHFWLVEREDDRAVVRVHERDATTERYVETGVHRGELKLGVPFPLTVDLDALGRRPG